MNFSPDDRAARPPAATAGRRRELVLLALAVAGLLLVARWCAPSRPHFTFPLEGKASWYSRNSPGVKKTTANNERFDDLALTCALWDVPFNQRVKVTNLADGRSVICRVNDRGPHPRFVRKGRVIDLTKTAFRLIGPTVKGMVDVRVELIE